MWVKRDTGWTEEKINILKKFYPIGGPELCQKKGIKDKSIVAITKKANSLNLKSNEWTKLNNDILFKYYVKYGALYCQQHGLENRSISSIREQARKLGLRSKANNWTKEEDDILREVGKGRTISEAVKYVFYHKLLLNRTEVAIRNRLCQLNCCISKRDK